VLSGSNLKSLRKFCNNYKAPEESSPGFKILYEELTNFEADLHFHMHLENNVLFPKVLKLIQS
jgi:regulator of cell morphogenesis and NO signaling